MTDDKRPREWFIKNSFQEDHANIHGPKTKGCKVIEKSAYDALAKENAALKAEVERLKDTPGGKRLYLTFNELAREREITAMFREALETIEPVIKQVGDEWPESSADSSLANEYLGVTIIISEALAREKEMRK